jgi:carbon-monoxide dehydrogenase medium subunit
MAAGVGNIRVRSVGTIGGNLAFAEPHSDPATLLAAAGGTVELSDESMVRRLPVEDFVVGGFQTNRRQEEVLVAVTLPPLPKGAALAHQRVRNFERPAATLAVRLDSDQGRIVNARVVVGSIGVTVSSLFRTADALIGASLDDGDAIRRAAGEAASECSPDVDLNGSEEYKRHLVSILFQRAALAAASSIRTSAA